MKKIISGIAVLLAVCTLPSCLKDKAYDDNKYGEASTAVNELPFVQLLEGGLRQFSRSNLLFANPTAPLDSATFSVYYVGPASGGASSAKAPTDITVTLGYDAAALAAYNATPGNATYEKLPDSTFTFTQTSVVIKAGTDISKVTIYFKPDKIDGTKLYMLPISITAASGGLFAASNNKTMYFHKIGNPLSGKYSWRYRRWQGADTTVGPLQDVVTIVNLLSVSSTEIMTRETYTTSFIDPAGGIVLGFTNSGGVLSGFNLSLLPTTLALIPAGGFTLSEGPKFATGGAFNLVGTGATSYIGTNFSTYIQYINSTPAFRSLVNSFIKIP